MINYKTPHIDTETWKQLVNLELDALNKNISSLDQLITNVSTRVKIIENAQIFTELNFLRAEINKLKLKSSESKQPISMWKSFYSLFGGKNR